MVVGKAANSEKLGGQLSSYYATKTDVQTNTENISTLTNDIADIRNVITRNEYTFTLLAKNWTNKVYTVEHESITTTSKNYFTTAIGITSEQVEALQAAIIVDNGQEAGKAYLLALGEVPTIDIPVRLVVEGAKANA